MEPKLTPWFDWPVKPVLPGLYDVRLVVGPKGSGMHNDLGRCHWDGAEFANALGFVPVVMDGDQWRGLAERPE